MPDVSTLTGSRTSRGRRGSANVPLSQGAQVSLESTNRTVRDGTGAARGAIAFQGASRSLAKFYPWLQKQEAEKYKADQEAMDRKADEYTAAQNAKIQADPKGAIKAIREGTAADYFGDSGLDAQRDHVAQTYLRKQAGTLTAADQSDEVEALLNEASKNGQDPYQVLKTYIDKQNEGMDHYTADAYNSTTRKLALPHLRAIDQNKLAAGQLNQAQLGIGGVQADLYNGTIAANPEGLETMTRQLTMSLPGDVGEATMEAPKVRDALLLDGIAAGNTNALKMAYVKDPKTGRSLYDTDRAGVETARQQWIQFTEQTKDWETSSHLQDLNDRLQAITAGKGAEGDSYQKILDEAFAVDPFSGGSERDSILGKATRAMLKGDLLPRNLQEGATMLRDGQATDAHIDRMGEMAWATVNGGGSATPGDYNIAAHHLQNFGLPDAAREANENMIMNGGEGITGPAFGNLVATYQGATPQVRRNMFKTDLGRAMFEVTLDEHQKGRSPEHVRDQAIEADDGGDPYRAYERQLKAAGSEPSEIDEQIQTDAEHAWDAFREQDRTINGTWDEQTQATQNHVIEKLNLQAWAMGRRGSKDQLVAQTARALYGDFSPTVTVDGETVNAKVGVFNPPVTIGPDGEAVPGTNITPRVIELFRMDSARQRQALGAEGWTGKWYGIENDIMTQDGFGAVMMLDTDYGIRPAYWTPNQMIETQLSRLNNHPGLTDHMTIHESYGNNAMVSFNTPEDPTKVQRIELDGGSYLIWNPKYGTWSQRWGEIGAQPADKKIVSDMYGNTKVEYGQPPVPTLPKDLDGLRRHYQEKRRRREKDFDRQRGEFTGG